MLYEPMAAQRFEFLGAGAAGIGIARLVRSQMRREGASEDDIRKAIVMLDSNGLTFVGRDPLDDDAVEFALTDGLMRFHRFAGASRYSLEKVIRQVVPDIVRWTDGQAIVATGSPFDPVTYEGRTSTIGQANNAFCFPGIGLGAIVAEAHEISDEMFLAAAEACAASVTPDRLEQGSLYPAPVGTARRVPDDRRARRDRGEGRRVGRVIADDDVHGAVDAMMWYPAYAPYRRVEPV